MLPHALYNVADGAEFCLFVKVGNAALLSCHARAPPPHRPVAAGASRSTFCTCGKCGVWPLLAVLYSRLGCYLHSVMVCLLSLQDPSKDVKAKLEATPVPGFVKVIGYTKLRKNFREYEQKRELCKRYEAFFTDDRILPMLPALLGKVRTCARV